ncbi:hypothetical protein Bca4012_027578 [Brassica carinata]
MLWTGRPNALHGRLKNVKSSKSCILGENKISRQHFQNGLNQFSIKSVLRTRPLRHVTRRKKLRFVMVPRNWDHVIHWLLSLPKRSPGTGVLYQVWAAVLFEVWRERNRRYHDGTTLPEGVLIRNIMRMVKDKGIALLNTGHSLGADLLHFWSSRP